MSSIKYEVSTSGHYRYDDINDKYCIHVPLVYSHLKNNHNMSKFHVTKATKVKLFVVLCSTNIWPYTD